MILMYHKVSPDSPTMWWVAVDEFRRQMLELRDRKVVFLDEYDPANESHVVITFDGVYRNVLQYAAPILSDLGYPFELFVTANYIGHDNKFDAPEPYAEFANIAELSKLVSMGGRLQWHGNAHLNLEQITDAAQIEAELAIPASLPQLDPHGFRWFAYPHGTFNEHVLEHVRPRFIGAVSCHQGDGVDPCQLNRVTVTNESSFRKRAVSVIIPCYNYGGYLAEAVESVLRQTLSPQEILISDDASTDSTHTVLKILERKYGDRIRIHRNEKNLGIVPHFNQAIAMTTGDYVCFLGADNRFRSDYLEHTVGALDKNPDAAIAYTNFALFGARAETVHRQYMELWPTKVRQGEFFEILFPEFNEQTKAELISNINFIHGSSLIRRRAFDMIGGYQEREIAEDWNLFRNLIVAGWSAVHVSLPLLEYRQHSRLQANIRLESATTLRYYMEAYQELEKGLRDIQSYVQYTRSSFAWKVATPIRVIENFIRKKIKKK